MNTTFISITQKDIFFLFFVLRRYTFCWLDIQIILIQTCVYILIEINSVNALIAAELHMIFCEIVTMLVVGKIRGLKNYKDTVLILPFIMEIVGLH